MATKSNCSCFAKAADDEPLFVLRAQDKLAPTVVRIWAQLALQTGAPMSKVTDAHDVADEMERYPNRKLPD